MARLGSARLGSARLGSARLVSRVNWHWRGEYQALAGLLGLTRPHSLSYASLGRHPHPRYDESLAKGIGDKMSDKLGKCLKSLLMKPVHLPKDEGVGESEGSDE